MDTGTTLRAGSNILGFANYFTSGTAEDNAVVEGTGVLTLAATALSLSLPLQNITDCLILKKVCVC